jgi:hypothetical protein
MLRLLAAPFFVCLVASNALAQGDTTPPVLLDFTVAPTVIDTGSGNVVLNFCAVGRDDLAGFGQIAVGLRTQADQDFLEVNQNAFPDGQTDFEFCGSISVPQFTAYQTFNIRVTLIDTVVNTAVIGGPALCDLGFPCEIVNRSADTLQDSDMDGVPDDADNCVNDPNPDQGDADLDLIGDVCDAFPDDRDNEQAQCEADLAICFAFTDLCTQDSDCDPESTCVGGVCSADPTCRGDADCPTGEVCDPFTGRCVVDATCGGHPDCSGGWICVGGACREAVGCTADTDCPPGTFCLGDVCFLNPTCATDTDCPADERCDGGFCQPVECVADADCNEGWECLANRCALGGFCEQDHDCPGGTECLLGFCAPIDLPPDGDGDGEPDVSDQCPGTPAGGPVDDSGCSIDQFCDGIDVSTRFGRRLCRRADWRNDEPIGRPRDCAIDWNGTFTLADDGCMPK